MNPDPNFTDCHDSLLTLTSAQSQALEAIDGGASHAEAARLAGVDRTTVSRWANHHPAFRAELNQRRIDRARRHQESLDGITTAALEVIKSAIEEGDQAIALQWVKVVGVSSAVEGSQEAGLPETLIENHRLRMRTHRDTDLEIALGYASRADAEEDLLSRMTDSSSN